jgi:hypothetical protein
LPVQFPGAETTIHKRRGLHSGPELADAQGKIPLRGEQKKNAGPDQGSCVGLNSSVQKPESLSVPVNPGMGKNDINV